MNTDEIVVLLVAERDHLNRVIEVLQGPVAANRRGRPPKKAPALMVGSASAPAAATPAPAKKGRRDYTDPQRQAQSEKLKAYWKRRKAADAKK